MEGMLQSIMYKYKGWGGEATWEGMVFFRGGCGDKTMSEREEESSVYYKVAQAMSEREEENNV